MQVFNLNKSRWDVFCQKYGKHNVQQLQSNRNSFSTNFTAISFFSSFAHANLGSAQNLHVKAWSENTN